MADGLRAAARSIRSIKQTVKKSSLGRFFGKVPRLSDKVVLTILAIFVFLTAFITSQAVDSLWFTLQSLWGIAGFLLISVMFAAYARASAADQLTAKVFAAGGTIVVVIAASAFGVFSPFCSCGVVPIVAALLAGGAPLAAVMAFWMSSPLMDPEMFLLTAGELGMELAVARLVAAFGMGLLAGYATWALQSRGLFGSPLKQEHTGKVKSVDEPDELIWAFWRHPERRATFSRELRQTGFFLTKWLVLAFVLESLMVAYIPADTVGTLLGSGSLLSVPLAILVGVPTYLNGYAAIPTVAGLMDLGMSEAAALAFMTAGGVTSIPAAMAVFALVKSRVFGWYLALAFVGSAMAGFAYVAFTTLL